ncbi:MULTISPECIES: Na+/H+ antiporter subunit E [unclassified Sulfitobacter]|uniref:Na+/H+ antiporter subunit E n=1 Tax=unclassified Sulfitobacter TaxID=196795 RepID=UPI0007C3D0D0|nr:MULTISPECIES: Na+/H+ antiporter subunit E [unclassified Sulfitobacter]KZY02208.1 cation:proton antiporter [Sulfitobacter sp. HI0023]KZY25789.1 cation:proton antiporter [Sulfitobacter sp. HI0040]KZZ62744.1 cation:proton antiporter [Sulfitobacter sp. HI0129]
MRSRVLNRLLPHPLLTVLLVAVWALLNNSVSLGTFVVGLFLGWIIPAATAAYWPDRPAVPRPFKLLTYAVIVIWDILVANVVVALIVLFKPNRNIKSAWVEIPLELRAPEAITMLAGTITLTPGTLSADLSRDGRSLLVHALHAPDPDAVRDDIKNRYERRLKEIFQ